MVMKIGKNALDNFKILSESNTGDIFFHLSSFPSAFVILSSPLIDDEMIELAAITCKQCTKFRNIPNIYVDFCDVSNVTATSKAGTVTYIRRRQVKRIKI